MPLVMDPAGSEIRALRKTVQWRGKRVLEIGCGTGHFTELFARAPAPYTGVATGMAGK